jgi:hypothetical protein
MIGFPLRKSSLDRDANIAYGRWATGLVSAGEWTPVSGGEGQVFHACIRARSLIEIDTIRSFSI